MSKATGRVMKKVVDKVNHSSKLRTNIPAGNAVAGPPLGPMLGQVSTSEELLCSGYLFVSLSGFFVAWHQHCCILQGLQRTHKRHKRWHTLTVPSGRQFRSNL